MLWGGQHASGSYTGLLISAFWGLTRGHSKIATHEGLIILKALKAFRGFKVLKAFSVFKIFKVVRAFKVFRAFKIFKVF